MVYVERDAKSFWSHSARPKQKAAPSEVMSPGQNRKKIVLLSIALTNQVPLCAPRGSSQLDEWMCREASSQDLWAQECVRFIGAAG